MIWSEFLPFKIIANVIYYIILNICLYKIFSYSTDFSVCFSLPINLAAVTVTTKFFFVDVLMDNSPGVCTYVFIIDFMITSLPVESITEGEQNLNAEISWRRFHRSENN